MTYSCHWIIGILLFWCYLTSAPPSVDHRLLLDKLYRIGNVATHTAGCIHTYQSEHKWLGDHTLQGVLICALAYRSVLGPLLFTVYCGLDDIFKRHQLKYHMVEFPRDQQVPATAARPHIL